MDIYGYLENSQPASQDRNFLICTVFPRSTLRSFCRSTLLVYLIFYHLILKDSTLGGGQKADILYPYLVPLLSCAFCCAILTLCPKKGVDFLSLSFCIKFCSFFPCSKTLDTTSTFSFFQTLLQLTNIVLFPLKRISSCKSKALWLSILLTLP